MILMYKLFCSENAMSLFNVLRTCHKWYYSYTGAVYISPANRDDACHGNLSLGSQNEISPNLKSRFSRFKKKRFSTN